MSFDDLPKHTLISYSEQNQPAQFLDIDELLQEKDPEKIKRVWNGILLQVTKYDPKSTAILKSVNTKIYKRLTQLNTQKNMFQILKRITGFAQSQEEEAARKEKQTAIDSFYTSLSKHIDLLEQSTKEKQIVEEIQEIRQLNKKRKAEPSEELERLEKIPRVRRSLIKINRSRKDKSLKPELNAPQQVAIAHSIELRENLKEKYFVINHGQNIEMMIVTLVATILKEFYEPKKYETYQVLRHDIYLQQIRDDLHNIDWFRQQLQQKNDHDFRTELICGDCYLENTQEEESAIDFFAGKTNIAIQSSADFLKNILEGILANYFPDGITRSILLNHLLELTASLPKDSGTIYSICIPKENFSVSAYCSTAFGKPCREGKYTLEIIDQFQSGLSPDENPSLPFEMGTFGEKTTPQIRLLSHKLRPEDGVMIIPQCTLSEQRIQEIKDEISLLIQKAQVQFKG